MADSLEKLTPDEAAMLERLVPAVRGCACRHWGRRRQAFDSFDLEGIGLLSVAYTLIKYRGDPVRDDWEHFSSIALCLAREAMSEFAWGQVLPCSAPAQQVYSAVRGKRRMPESTRRRLLCRRAGLGLLDRRLLARRGRSGEELPVRPDQGNAELTAARLAMLRSAVDQVVSGFRGGELTMARMLQADMAIRDERERRGAAGIAAALGVSRSEVERFAARMCRRVLSVMRQQLGIAGDPGRPRRGMTQLDAAGGDPGRLQRAVLRVIGRFSGQRGLAAAMIAGTRLLPERSVRVSGAWLADLLGMRQTQLRWLEDQIIRAARAEVAA